MTRMPSRWGPDWEWHALLIEPAHEFQVQSLLVDPEDEDPPFHIHLPVRHAFSRPRNGSRRRNLVARPLYPGYLLLGVLPQMRPAWRPILETPGVVGVIGPILERTLIAMLATASRPRAWVGQVRRRRKGQRTAEIVSGPYQGRTVRTVEIADADPEIYDFAP